MASFRQDVNRLGKSNGLNDSIARETIRPPLSKYSNLHASLRPTPLRMVSVSSLNGIEFQSAYNSTAREHDKQDSRE